MPTAPPPVEELDWEDRDFDKEIEDIGKGLDGERRDIEKGFDREERDLDTELDWEDKDFDQDLADLLRERRALDGPPLDWDADEEGGAQQAVTACDDRRFVRFTVLGTVFEVTSKYGPPFGFIGGGAYGTVCHAFDLRNGKTVAIKKIRNAFVDAVQAKMTLREVMLLRHMNHPNVVTLVDIIPPQSQHVFTDLYVVSELVHTDMNKVIHSKKDLSPDICKKYLFQLLCGMKYLHSRNILHRDLKPSNLLVSAEGVVKICDFGQARTISKKDRYLTKLVGTRSYKAPEVLLHASEYDAAVDIWSIGCIFAELILKTVLFPAVDDEEQLGLILQFVGTPAGNAELSFLDTTARRDVRRHPHYPKKSLSEKLAGVDQFAADLIDKMLRFDPGQRISIQEAMAHPYFQGFHDTSEQEVCHVPSFDEHVLSVQEMKNLIYNESLLFNPHMRS